MERVILHSDLNNCYASIECMLHPELRGKYIAVCGSTEERHGIVLAKNQLAKQCGVKTGDVIWEARQKCPQLTIVPPHMDQYLKFSKLVRSIYLRYSPEVESFGIDESWISLTGSPLLKNRTPVEIANEIRETVKAEVGLTVSIGVSFNKIFAKLGSDMKKPDAVTEIRPDTFREQIWPLPASDLLYVGRATEEKLRRYCIHTIGDLAQTDKDFLVRLLGVNGEKLWSYANGLDSSRVMPCDYELPIKSIGHGITCTEDLVSEYEVRCVFRELSQEVGLKLRKNKLAAMGVRIAVRDNILSYRQYQCKSFKLFRGDLNNSEGGPLARMTIAFIGHAPKIGQQKSRAPAIGRCSALSSQYWPEKGKKNGPLVKTKEPFYLQHNLL